MKLKICTPTLPIKPHYVHKNNSTQPNENIGLRHCITLIMNNSSSIHSFIHSFICCCGPQLNIFLARTITFTITSQHKTAHHFTSLPHPLPRHKDTPNHQPATDPKDHPVKDGTRTKSCTRHNTLSPPVAFFRPNATSTWTDPTRKGRCWTGLRDNY